MDILQQENWLREVLREVMRAVMLDESLRAALIFKGAWILNFQLGEDRSSRDIDATGAPDWHNGLNRLADLEALLTEQLPRALRRHFESHSPVRYTMERCTVKRKPHREHPRGWNMLVVRMHIRDHLHAGVHGLPPAELEVAAEELLGPKSTEMRNFLGAPARVYTLHRIAGEKLRAYLTSLPEYRDKMGGARDMRVKDLYDLARILACRAIAHTEFWTDAAEEFRLACQSRYVDCAGPAVFKQAWERARHLYEQDRHFERIAFAEAEAALDSILAFLVRHGVFPLEFPAPPLE